MLSLAPSPRTLEVDEALGSRQLTVGVSGEHSEAVRVCCTPG